MKKTKHKQAEIAEERIKELFKQADSMFNEDKALANRYVTLARKISMKYQAPIPKSLKRSVCKSCYKYLKPGINATVRTGKQRVIIRCRECGHIARFPYIKEIKAKRRSKMAKKL